ncbi:hypothetical protein BDV37DRAFT_89837 [Aspergillus pseudonomiae]|uniref:P-loop containing nucleoside triphosphate hydrolase protein n=1 Tax=Aspergillus pseudonomiae TaxID=1506151 RepID=A0A5N7DGM8_9EURO|nr:uncharacterized protein BDV37DRAFT_89837 [Aspergillus pseudonomiae]KAE8405571.1 hypothetical protein BDV37DRAFT_89837 [Aspergillus pseudonomiae]
MTLDPLYHTLYNLPSPSQKRTQPMQVLAVGISRSGTESLREALHMLDINHTHHGFDTILPPSSLQATYRLLQKKYTGPPTTLTASDFDTVLGGCVGVTDLIAAEFAPELIAAYPDAKVILNVRRDLDGWYKSMQLTMGYFDRNPVDWDWCKSWFCAELFWIRQCMCRTMMPRFFRGSFESNGRWVYENHVAAIRGLGLGERLLEWSVDDGWEPLCRFLGKEVPDCEFPSGNPPKAWAERIARTMEVHHRRAVRNMLVFLAGLGVALGVLGAWLVC